MHTKITFQTEVYDTASELMIIQQTIRFTVPTGTAGKYFTLC